MAPSSSSNLMSLSNNMVPLEIQTESESTRFVCDPCRRSFAGSGALNYHARTCRATKKRTGNALEKVREAWQQARETKRMRMDPVPSFIPGDPPPHKVPGTTITGLEPTSTSLTTPEVRCVQQLLRSHPMLILGSRLF